MLPSSAVIAIVVAVVVLLVVVILHNLPLLTASALLLLVLLWGQGGVVVAILAAQKVKVQCSAFSMLVKRCFSSCTLHWQRVLNCRWAFPFHLAVCMVG